MIRYANEIRYHYHIICLAVLNIVDMLIVTGIAPSSYQSHRMLVTASAMPTAASQYSITVNVVGLHDIRPSLRRW
jgi:hypothetical protein